jgi:phospholipid transport system substrate-binding protein
MRIAARRARVAREGTEPAVTQIRAFYEALLTVMKQADKLGIRGRYEQLAPVVRATFDLAAMTRIAIGSDWNSIPAELQIALVDNFARMTIATYAARFDGYSGERFEVEPATAERNTGRIVRTKLLQSNGEPITLNYLVRGSGESWKIVDVYLTGTISELATRRSEFGAILKSGGPNALIDSLRQRKAAELFRLKGRIAHSLAKLFAPQSHRPWRHVSKIVAEATSAALLPTFLDRLVPEAPPRDHAPREAAPAVAAVRCFSDVNNSPAR